MVRKTGPMAATNANEERQMERRTLVDAMGMVRKENSGGLEMETEPVGGRKDKRGDGAIETIATIAIMIGRHNLKRSPNGWMSRWRTEGSRLIQLQSLKSGSSV